MTWEQFLSALAAIAVTALVRLVNQWLPPPEERAHVVMAPEGPRPGAPGAVMAEPAAAAASEAPQDTPGTVTPPEPPEPLERPSGPQ